MKRFGFIVVLLLLMGVGEALGQRGSAGAPELKLDTNYSVRTVRLTRVEEVDGETVLHYRMNAVPVYARLLIDRQKNARLIRNVKLVYPIALYANRKLLEMESVLATMGGDRRAQERYTKEVEKELKEQYTPIIKKMSFSQGKVLIKLIDRQTGQTSYELVREMRGKFSAFFWQNLGRLFGMNLKTEYDAEGDDQLIEQIIRYHEAGVL